MNKRYAGLLLTATLTAVASAAFAEIDPNVNFASSTATAGSSQQTASQLPAHTHSNMPMMSAKTPEERQVMMNERMKNMSPEMLQQCLQMMQ
jgi:hypothetical protein